MAAVVPSIRSRAPHVPELERTWQTFRVANAGTHERNTENKNELNC
eukprot:COSAG02_NODE_6070_length_3826_cov_2.878723_5_plen_46_part_00